MAESECCACCESNIRNICGQCFQRRKLPFPQVRLPASFSENQSRLSFASRPRHFTRRAVLAAAEATYSANYSTPEGRLSATFDLVFLTGWTPHESQQQPLRPGSAKQRLADALQVPELPLKDS